MKKPKPINLIALMGILFVFSTKTFSQTNTSKKETKMNTTENKEASTQIFIDNFFVPKNAKQEFDERAKINRDLLRTLPGFIEDNFYQRTDENGDFIIVTVAVWKDAEAIKKAKEAVQAQYKKEGFDMQGMLKRLNITIDRGVYKKEAKQEASQSVQKIDTSMLILIDKVSIPVNSITEFNERWKLNRDFIKKQPGFIDDIAYESIDEKGNLSYATFVVWKNKEAFDKAMLAVQAEYKREGFDMTAMLKRTNVVIDRIGIFKKEAK